MKEIASYINSRTTNEMALLVNGKWGYGKTFHVRRVAEEEQKENGYVDRVYYVTLNGISSLGSIDDQLIAQKFKMNNKLGKVASGVLKTAMRIAIRNSEDTKMNEGDFASLNWNNVVSFNDCVFIIDDLERCPLDKERVLGYVHRNYLLDSDNRVVYICDEDKIPEGEKKKFKAIKEKYVGWTVAFRPNFEDAGQAIFNKFPLLKDTVDIKDLLLWSAEIECFNLRTLQFFFSTLSVVKHLQPQDDYARSILQFSLLVLCKYYKDGLIESGMQVTDLPAYLNPRRKEQIASEMLENPDLRALLPVRTLYDNPKICYDEIPLAYTISDQLLNLVTSLSYDSDELQEHILKLERRYAVRYLSPTVRRAKKLYNYTHLITAEYTALRDEMISGIYGNTFDAIDLLSALKAVRFLCQQEEEFTGLSMKRWAEIETLVVQDSYRVALPEGDQRSSEYDFSGGISALVPDTRHPLYCKFYNFFSLHQQITDDLTESLPDLTATPILHPVTPGAWKDQISDYLKHVSVNHFDLLIEKHQENHVFLIGVFNYLYGLDVSQDGGDIKELVNEFAKRIEVMAAELFKSASLSEAKLLKDLSESRTKIAFT